MTLHSFLTNRFLSLEGKLYSGNLSEVQFKIEAALDKTQSLIIDLDQLERFDAAGAYMLYITSEKARENNKEIILFCRENERVKLIFSFVGIQYHSKIPKTDLTSVV
jgi:anti-anti-sigma regulatory factor